MPDQRPLRRWNLVAAGCVFAATLALLIATGGLYGITYDEPIYQSKSMQALEWLDLALSSPGYAFSDDAIDRYWSAKDAQPGFFKLITAICGATVGKFAAYNAVWRTGTNVLAAFCFAALYLFVSALWGRAAGLYAVAALLLMPRVFAHCHLAALDAPIMSLSFLTVAACWQVCVWRGADDRAQRRSAWLWSIAAGVLWGFALGTKLNSFFIPFIVFPWALVFARKQFWKLAAGFAVFGPLAFWLTWPWLWHDTVARFVEYFQFHLTHYPVSVMYFGKSYDYAPWHYALVMAAITMPPVTALLAFTGLRPCIAALRAKLPQAPSALRATVALVLWALFVNWLPSCLPMAPKYGGVRLFLPIFPWLAVLAAIGLSGILKGLRLGKQGEEARRKIVALCLFAALLGPMMATAKFLPYPMSYYNILIGGLPGATRAGMEPTYWGDTYRSAALWLAEHAEPGATVWIEPIGFESTVRLFELGPMRPDIAFSSGPEGFESTDYAVTQNKPTEFTDITRRLVAQQRPVFTDGVDGVPLVYVFKMK